jgi:RNA polymerase-binding transcription factor DksA
LTEEKGTDKINLLIDRDSQRSGFGICEESGMRIPEERLLIMPDASLCVPCQKDLEKFEYRKNLAKTPYPCSNKERIPARR